MESSIAIFGFILLLVAVLWFFHRIRVTREAELQAAHDAYQGALGELRAAPTNPDVKQRALELGRAYSSLTREQKGTTIFDEMALSNDISAATAGATATRAPSAAPVNTADRLRRLDELRKDGLVSDEEYQQRRARILEDV